ncbi:MULTISPECIES: S41 family peptidase [unclassified Acinetobacter]|uniref:S41 family peptidase n=1 Tax=unclassified Acinetobacter TaxID=196816 RepID=UPI00293476D3|nr:MULTISPECIES: S41 family peptidase [unclassified Acinetobacter]WOE30673.1 S41 family peptidase [Acinetobacter sp. SAAs470]WOE38866.1 S41 family peptidase [Acinetobacter sp. SAAs474]
MAPHKNMIFAMILLCVSLSACAARPPVNPLDLDDDIETNTGEVPVESIQKFVRIYSLVKDNYVKDKNDDQLFQQAIQGLVGGLDRYSRYLTPEEYKQLVQYTEGDIASVDFELIYNTATRQWLVQALKSGSDSYKQGLRNGMSVFKIDDQELLKLNPSQVNNLLSGAIGSTLSIQFNDRSQPMTLVRNKKIETDIQAQLLSNHVLVLKIRVFQQSTASEIKNLIEQYQSSGIKAVLIDLRNNPGGLLSAAVESADLFLDQGVIVSTKSRSESDQQFQALPSFEFDQLKLGILINHRSASAAEVFTAALKEHQRAWVIGEKSYGKGVVQKLFPLSDDSALQMTVSHYYTPSGKEIEGIGIEPNQVYPLPYEMKDDVYLQHVAELLLHHKP